MPRPKEFDPDTALEQAIEVFWRRGYDGTSVQDLVQHIGINRFSLYDTFGDKRQLFLAAMEKYRENFVSKRLAELERSERGLEAIRKYFTDVIDFLTTEEGWRGCLMTNSAIEVAPFDEEVETKVRTHLTRMSDVFYAALKRAAVEGELEVKDGRRLRKLAWMLTNCSQGLGVLAKSCRERRILSGIVESTLASLE